MMGYARPAICLVCLLCIAWLAHPHSVWAGRTKVNENSYAIVIGIQQYRDIIEAEYAVNDARAVQELLIDKMGYPEENVLLLLDERATKADLEKYLLVWLKNRVDTQSSVFIYYSGHGAPDPNSGDSYIVPFDGDPNYIAITGYPVKKLYQSLAELPTRNVFIVMDSCFSGLGGRSVLAAGTRPVFVSVENPLLVSNNMVVFSSSQKNQISTSYPKKKHGLFTYFFLNGLEGEADQNRDGGIEIGELFSYLKPRVQKTARRRNIEQTPTLVPSPELIGNTIFKKTVFKIKKPVLPMPGL
jgi:uncharacterized caspase-like protein